MKEDRIFTDEELKMIGQSFEILFRAAKREGLLSASKDDTPKEPAQTQNRMIPLSKWNDFHSWPTVNSLRGMVFSSYRTGADYFVKKIANRLIVDESLFFAWCKMSDEEKEKSSPDMMKWKGKYGIKKRQ